jgi:protocatechuate 3,4-dioxygenase beta subunit
MTDHNDRHDLGLAHDLTTLVNRRKALGLFAGAGAVLLTACGSKSSNSSATTAPSATTGSATTARATAATTAGSATTAGAITATTAAAGTSAVTAADVANEIAQETAGPYPGDGTNGPNVLTQSGIVRRDITSSFGSSTTKAAGVPLSMRLQIVNIGSGTPMAGAAVYLWHCSADGRYSLYSNGATTENYLRGVQAADADGFVTFDSVFPGAYSGRWPHAHFEVFQSVAAATTGRAAITTSQLAFSEEVSNAVYATAGYEASPANMKRTTLANDNVFKDGVTTETPVFSGDVGKNLTATLVVPVK